MKEQQELSQVDVDAVSAPDILQAAWQSHERGEFQEAERLYRKALEQDPKNGEALNLFGILAAQSGKPEVAIGLIGQAVECDPENPQYYNNLGIIFNELGNSDEAIECYEKALSLAFDLPEAHNNLGILYKEFGRFAEAVASYEKALQLRPDFVEAFVNLGNALQAQGKFLDAIACYEKALEINENVAEAYSCLGNALKELQRFDDAIVCYQRAIEIRPDFVEARMNLGEALKNIGLLDEAMECFRQVQEVDPDYAPSYSSLANTLLYHDAVDGRAIFDEHRKWAARHAQRFYPSAQTLPAKENNGRPLRIGYVSHDFRNHATAFFIEPVLGHHDRNSFEIFCYYTCPESDAVTERLMGLPLAWRKVAGMSDDAMVKLIREDRIDILVDLMGHTGNHRLLVFARKPAPIQVTWIGYPNSTGLDNMDYWIGDPYVADPSGMTEQYSTEAMVELPGFFMCFRPSPDSPDVSILPALDRGYVTFGSFNALYKLTPAVLDLWAELLNAVPGSRLIMTTLPEGSAQQRVRERFARHGIGNDRLEVVSRVSHRDFLRLHQVVDIALDPFPYNGTTTTLHGFWMGVPIVTLAGKTFASRVGVSLLSNLGLPSLIAHTPVEYVEIAKRLAGDLPALQSLRAGLRHQMEISPLTDAARFTLNLEAAYREMWEKFRAKRHASDFSD